MDLSEEIKDFIFGEEDLEIYSHRTTSEDVARSIMKEGFRYADSFQKTTDEIIDDIIYLRYWDSMRKHYGNIIVILAFSKPLVESVRKRLTSNYEVHQALSLIENESYGDLTEEGHFILPVQYVKGFIHRETGEVRTNPVFDPHYQPPYLEKQIEILNAL